MALRVEWSRYATVIGILSCAMIALAFLVPWYGVDFDYWNGSIYDYRVEYSAGMELPGEYSAGIERAGDVMLTVTIVVTISFAASVIAAVLSYLRRRELGVIAGAFSAGLLLTAAVIFYLGVTAALHPDNFAGTTMLNRSWNAEAAPMLGWWIAVIVPVIQGVQAIVLAYSDDCKPRKSPR